MDPPPPLLDGGGAGGCRRGTPEAKLAAGTERGAPEAKLELCEGNDREDPSEEAEATLIPGWYALYIS